LVTSSIKIIGILTVVPDVGHMGLEICVRATSSILLSTVFALLECEVVAVPDNIDSEAGL